MRTARPDPKLGVVLPARTSRKQRRQCRRDVCCRRGFRPSPPWANMLLGLFLGTAGPFILLHSRETGFTVVSNATCDSRTLSN